MNGCFPLYSSISNILNYPDAPKQLPETFEKRPFLPNPPVVDAARGEADKFLRLPREMRSLFPWGHAQIPILEILSVFLRLKFSPSLNLNKNKHFSKVSTNEMMLTICVQFVNHLNQKG
jgi:hypothetical protein